MWNRGITPENCLAVGSRYGSQSNDRDRGGRKGPRANFTASFGRSRSAGNGFQRSAAPVESRSLISRPLFSAYPGELTSRSVLILMWLVAAARFVHENVLSKNSI